MDWWLSVCDGQGEVTFCIYEAPKLSPYDIPLFGLAQDQNRKHFISLSDLMPEQHGACSEDISQSKRLPDWQSVDPKDWAFFSPLPLGSS